MLSGDRCSDIVCERRGCGREISQQRPVYTWRVGDVVDAQRWHRRLVENPILWVGEVRVMNVRLANQLKRQPCKAHMLNHPDHHKQHREGKIDRPGLYVLLMMIWSTRYVEAQGATLNGNREDK